MKKRFVLCFFSASVHANKFDSGVVEDLSVFDGSQNLVNGPMGEPVPISFFSDPISTFLGETEYYSTFVLKDYSDLKVKDLILSLSSHYDRFERDTKQAFGFAGGRWI